MTDTREHDAGYGAYKAALANTKITTGVISPDVLQGYPGVAVASSALDHQPGGDHYRKYSIQPVQYIVANGFGFLAGNVIKYVTRYRDKNGAEDIRKAIHYLEMILEFEYGKP